VTINIFDENELEFERNKLLKKNWSQWKSLNQSSNTIFFPIFKEFVDHHLKKLSGGACKLYIFLGLVAQRSGESWYSIKSMAEYMDVSSRSIDNYIQELEDVGLVVRERSNSSSTTYLLPYSLNIYPVKPTIERSLGSIFEKAILDARLKERVVGSIYRAFHLFQWNEKQGTGCVQGIVVTTKKTYPKGPDHFNAFVYLDHYSNPEYIIDTPRISSVRSFTSNIQFTDVEIIGIAIGEEDKLLIPKNQKIAISQLCNAPIEHIRGLQPVNFVQPPNPVDAQ